MLSDVYRKIEYADGIRIVANKMNNHADDIEAKASVTFNEKIRIEYMEQLSKVMDDKNAFDSEKEEIQDLINKKQKGDLDIVDARTYRKLEEKYGENLDHNKSFIDRFMEHMEG